MLTVDASDGERLAERMRRSLSVRAAAVPTVVDRVVVVTERQIHPHKLARASLFHYCRFAQPEHDKVLACAANDFEGPATVRDFCRAAGIGDEGYHGAIRLIRKGILRTDVEWPLRRTGIAPSSISISR